MSYCAGRALRIGGELAIKTGGSGWAGSPLRSVISVKGFSPNWQKRLLALN